MHSHNGRQHDEHEPSPLLVMGEETIHIEKQPDGYWLIGMSEEGGTEEKKDKLQSTKFGS
jgi:hypothetical protein